MEQKLGGVLLLGVEGGDGVNGRFQTVAILVLQFTVITSLVTCFCFFFSVSSILLDSVSTYILKG